MRNYAKASLYLCLKILLPSVIILGSVFLSWVSYRTIELADITFLGVLWWFVFFVPEVVFLIAWGSLLMKQGVVDIFKDMSEQNDTYLEIKQVSNNTYEINEKQGDSRSIAQLLWALAGIVVAVISLFVFVFSLIKVAINKKLCEKYANSIKEELTKLKEFKTFMKVYSIIFCVLVVVIISVTAVYKVHIFNCAKNETTNIKYGSKYVTATVSKKENEEVCTDVYGSYYPIRLKMTIFNGCKKDIVTRYDFELVFYDRLSNEELFSDSYSVLGYIDSGENEDVDIYVFSTNPDLQNYDLSELRIDLKVLFVQFSSKMITYQNSQYITIYNGLS